MGTEKLGRGMMQCLRSSNLWPEAWGLTERKAPPPGSFRGLPRAVVVLLGLAMVTGPFACLEEKPVSPADETADQGPGPPDLGPGSDGSGRPVAHIVATPQAINEGAEVTTVVLLDGRGSSPGQGGGTLSYEWEVPGCRLVEGGAEQPWLRCAYWGEEPVSVGLGVRDAQGREERARLELPLNLAPRLTISAPATAPRNKEVEVSARAEDPEGEQLDASLSLDPSPGAELRVEADGRGALLARRPGTIWLRASATDSMGALGSTTSEIEVLNQPPVLGFIGGRGVRAGTHLVIELSASDPDGDPLSFAVDGLPPTASFAAAPPPDGPQEPWRARFDWTPAPEDAGEHPLGFSVSDGWDLDEEEIFITVLGDPGTPVLRLEPPDPSHELAVGELLRILARAWDPDGQPVTLAAAPLPPGASFDPRTGLFELFATADDAGEHEVFFSASDGQLQARRLVRIRVVSVNRPPTLSVLPAGDSFFVDEGEVLELQVQADDPDGDELTTSAQGLPENASYSSDTGLLRFAPDFEQAGAYRITLWASDGSLRSELRLGILVRNVNRAPAISIDPGTEIVALTGQACSFQVLASDPDGDELLLSVDRAPVGSSFDPDTGLFVWTPMAHQMGESRVELRATDLGAPRLAAVATVRITVRRENHPPTLIEPLPDLEMYLHTTETLDLGLYFRDPDGDGLHFILPAGPGWASIFRGSLILHPVDPGLVDQVSRLLVRASDGSEQVEDELTLRVLPLPEGSYDFLLIAAPGDAGPGAISIGHIRSPHLGAGPSVVFGSETEGERQGVYRFSEQEGLVKVAERLDQTPRREPFRAFGAAYPADAAGATFFVGYLWGGSGVFSRGGGNDIATLVRQDMAAPGGLRLGVVGMDSVNRAGDLGWCGFVWGRPGQRAVFAMVNAVLRTAAAPGAPAPGFGTFGSCLGKVVVGERGQVLFAVELEREQGWGLFSWEPGDALGPGSEQGEWWTVYRSDRPGELEVFDSILSLRVGPGGDVAFLAALDAGRLSLCLAPAQGVPTAVVSGGDAVPGRGSVGALGDFALDEDGELLFSMALAGQWTDFGIYRSDGQGFAPILVPGDSILVGLSLSSAALVCDDLGASGSFLYAFRTAGGDLSGYVLREDDGSERLVALVGDPLPGARQVWELSSVSMDAQGNLLFQQSPGGALYLGVPRDR